MNWELPTDPAVLKEIKTALQTSQEFLVAIERDKGSYMDIADEMKEKHGMPRRTFNRLAKTMFKGDKLEQDAKNNEFEEAWNLLVEESL